MFKWIVCLGCLAAFVLIALHLSDLAALDQAVYGALSALASPGMTSLALLLTGLVGPAVLLLITLPTVCFLPKKEYRIPLLLNLSMAVLLNLGLKHVFTRPRPSEVVRLVSESGYSFPSGHTMAAACFYGFLIFLVRRECSNRRLRDGLTALISTLIALVALSRVYLGAHYFTDVLAGLCVSVCYLVVFTAFVDRFFTHDEPLKMPNIARSGRNRLLFSFSYAIQGVVGGLKSERNMVIHFAAMATVVVFGALTGISQTEWIVCVVLFGAVLMAEMFNTAIETVVDMICPREDPRAKLAKDTAAGAVLFMAAAAAIAGLIIFVPKLLMLLGER